MVIVNFVKKTISALKVINFHRKGDVFLLKIAQAPIFHINITKTASEY